MSFLAWLVVGAIAGWGAGLVMSGRGFGSLGNIVVGILGSFIGGFSQVRSSAATRPASTWRASSSRSWARSCCCSSCALSPAASRSSAREHDKAVA